VTPDATRFELHGQCLERRPIMESAPRVFEIEREGETLVVTLLTDLRELEYAHIEEAAAAVLESVSAGPVRDVVLDFSGTDHYGSTALGFFVKLWKRVRGRGGNMAFANLSAHEREILAVTGLDRLWPICGTRAEALVAVRTPAPTSPS
jgi:anti-anti-sigma factor